MKKFEFTGETKLCDNGLIVNRIRRLSDGALGGWLQYEKNLSHSGDAWVSDDACVVSIAYVSENAQIFDNAFVSGNSVVGGDAQIFDNAYVYGEVHISGNAQIFGDADILDRVHVTDNVRVFDNAYVSGFFTLTGNAVVTKNPIVINGLYYDVVITDDHISIGCVQHTKREWFEFDDKRILEMDGLRVLKFWQRYKETILTLGAL